MPNALISVQHSNGLDEVANRLIDCGFGLYASHGNAVALRKAGIEVRDMSLAYSSPFYRPIFSDSVFKFLPEIHAGLCAPDAEDYRNDLHGRAIIWFDLLLADLDFTIFFREIDRDCLEKSIDYGNRGLILSACCGHRAIICDELHIPRMDRIREIKEQGITPRTRMEMRIIAERKCADYGKQVEKLLCQHLPLKA